jgi:HAD superfamily hydrolase (TIGR01490 family)
MADKEKEIKIAVFDLNGTLYNKTSKDEFFKFICTKKVHKVGNIFQMTYYQLLSKFHQINQTEFKENFFNYLDNISPKQVEVYADEYWKKEFPKHFNKEIMQRLAHLKKQGIKIFCATGGLELYVKPLFKLYKVDGMVGTVVKYVDNTYKIEGEACKSEEKLRRLGEQLHGKPYHIVEAYSDSKEDILDQADKAFLVKKGKLIDYK